MSLKAKASGAIFWSFVDRVAQYGLQSAVSIVLARLLLPSEVGLIGMLWVFISLTAMFSDVGFSPALIQKEASTERDHCSVFYFNIAASIAGMALLWLLAPAIASFYGNDQLISLTRIISLMLPCSAIGIIHSTLLNKKLDLKSQAKASLASGIISGGVAIFMAWLGCGVWSLVGQSLAQSIIRSLLLWKMSSWRPTASFSFAALSAMWPFGSRVLLSACINTVVDNIFPVAIGKFYSPAVLGFYTMAVRIPFTFASSLSSIIGRVSIPLYPKLRDQPAVLRNTYKKTMTMIALVNTPLMVGIAVVADPLIKGLLTEKWVPAIPYIQLVSLAMIFLPIFNSNMDALTGFGRADLHLRFTMINKLLRVINVAISFRLGIIALLCGEIAANTITCTLQAFSIGKILNYSVAEQLKDIAPIAIASAVMGASVLGTSVIPLHQPLLSLSLKTCVGALVFLSICHLFRLEAYREIIDMLKILRAKSKAKLA